MSRMMEHKIGSLCLIPNYLMCWRANCRESSDAQTVFSPAPAVGSPGIGQHYLRMLGANPRQKRRACHVHPCFNWSIQRESITTDGSQIVVDIVNYANGNVHRPEYNVLGISGLQQTSTKAEFVVTGGTGAGWLVSPDPWRFFHIYNGPVPGIWNNYSSNFLPQDFQPGPLYFPFIFDVPFTFQIDTEISWLWEVPPRTKPTGRLPGRPTSSGRFRTGKFSIATETSPATRAS